MDHRENYLNRYFWMANVLFWLAVYSMVVHMQFGIVNDIGRELSWLRAWVYSCPWFLNWIWITAAIHCVLLKNNQKENTRTRSILKHLTAMLVLLSCYWIVGSTIRILLQGDELSQFMTVFTNTIFNNSIIDMFIYIGILSSGLSIRLYHSSIYEHMAIKRLKYELTQEQLKTLRSQLNPHFLFNALNTIASLVRLKREKEAVTALSELSFMLRKILEQKNLSDIKIKDEIEFINSYLAIQKMRFSDKLCTQVSVQPDCLELKIPNMILHPLIENAVQHGSQLESNQNLLKLEITRDKHELKLLMTNKAAKHDTHEGFGIGLSNTKERLSKIYTHFRLESHPIKNDLFETLLVIPIGEYDA